MSANPRRMAEVIRMPTGQGAPAPVASSVSAARPAEPPAAVAAEELSRDKISSQLEAWQAPILPDEIVDTMATIFLMQPGHELMPFFLWLEGKVK